MVSPVFEAGKQEKGPPWLRPLLRTSFFVPCEVHGDSYRSECNLYCLECMGSALCSYCLSVHRDHQVIQIRRSSYHDVIRVSEVSKLIDISCIQTYIINSAKIVFLNARPQRRPRKVVTNTCDICCRGLLDSFRFCSIACKLTGTATDPDLTFALRPKPGRECGSESDESTLTPRKLQKTAGGDGGSSSISSGTPPIVSYRTSSSRRKGVPRRAPF
ncbi:hypothetical protein Cni_G04110 [Canna indica]|uniref:PLATZ transcription factor family protein n=1 Tax=Canna indica TaxID=4628 RepID=A0AAQ3JS94_9LILI|nr:hypothetical protein Cni_G04110 [Canna indica]